MGSHCLVPVIRRAAVSHFEVYPVPVSGDHKAYYSSPDVKLLVH